MKWVPFTAHISINPATGKKFEYWRDMQKIASLVYEALETITPDTLSIAQPGGGQQRSYSNREYGGMSGLSHACAAKPRMGQVPAQLQISGFYKSSALNIQPHPALKTIHAGEILSGPGSHNNDSIPVSTINTEVKALKTVMESAISTNVPGLVYAIYRLDYSGVTYGNRGYHFPL